MVNLQGQEAPPAPAHRLCVLHTMDPRGAKVGGVETHVRLLLAHFPADMSILFVGVDEKGDCALGKLRRLVIGGRSIDFLPVARVDEAAVNASAKRLHQSLTLRFAIGALTHLGAIRAAIGRGEASCDYQRMEFAVLPKLLRRPGCLMLHIEGAKALKEDSLLQRFRWIARLNEGVAVRLADHIFCVSPAILERVRSHGGWAAGKAELLTVSVDTDVFRPKPFDCGDGVLRLLYAGRLDMAKDPALMFTSVARLRTLLGEGLEFHYAGGGDPSGFPEFAPIADISVRHGILTSPAIAALSERCHAGILTSHFEGMPCFLLETLAAGRPLATIRQPQFDGLLEPGVSGEMVERSASMDESADRVAKAFLLLWERIKAGRIDISALRAKIEPFAVDTQLRRLFEQHRELVAGTRNGAAQLPRPAPASSKITSVKSAS